MKTTRITTLLCFVLAALLSCTTVMSKTIDHCSLKGKVVKTADGDTVKVLDAKNKTYKIRLAGIDAPERKQAYGKAATKFLSKWINQKTVCVDWHKRDHYGRLVGATSWGNKI